MGFATTAETNYEGSSLPVLAPDIYDNVSFLGAKREDNLKKDDGTPLTPRITFGFKTADGQPFNHSELKPDENAADFDSKSSNLTKRIGHILSKFYTPQQLIQNNTSWDSYANWVIQMASAANKNQKVKIKITGSVYDNKARSGFKGYPPFIKKAGEDLSFDQNDLKGNAEYNAHQNVKPDNAGQAGGFATPNAASVGEF